MKNIRETLAKRTVKNYEEGNMDRVLHDLFLIRNCLGVTTYDILFDSLLEAGCGDPELLFLEAGKHDERKHN